MTILITGFDPFGGEDINPATEAVRALPDTIADARVIKGFLPTVFREASSQAIALIAQHQPDAVLCVGQAAGRAGITLERVGINIADARIPDNQGHQPVDEAIDREGPAAYFATLPLRAMERAVKEANLPASISNTAGTYVCNHLLYSLLRHADTHQLDTRIGFIHVPYQAEQAEGKTPPVPFMSLPNITTALIKCVEALVATTT